MVKFTIAPSGGGLGAKKVALADVGGDTYVAGGIDFKLKYKIIGAFCDQYNCKVVNGKVQLLGADGEISGSIADGTKVFLILSI